MKDTRNDVEIVANLRGYLLRDPEEITHKHLVEYLSNRTDNGKLVGPRIQLTDEFDLPAGYLKCIKNKIRTNAGLYLYNLMLVEIFDGEIDYVNVVLNKSGLGLLTHVLANKVMREDIDVEKCYTFFDNFTWLGYAVSEFTVPALSENLVGIHPDILKLKKQLLKEHADIIENNDVVGYVKNIEEPLLEKAKEVYKDDPSFNLFQSGNKKPTIENALKRCYIGIGVVPDPTTGEKRIITSSYNDGIKPEEYAVFGNEAIFGSYSRACGTAIGGAEAKEATSAMQSVSLGPKNSDCKSKNYIWVKLDPHIINGFIDDRYMIEGTKLVKLTTENKSKYIGKFVKFRSYQYCEFDSSTVCNMCAGDRYYDLGIDQIGLTSQIMGNILMNASMKLFHDMSLKFVELNPEEYLQDYIPLNKRAAAKRSAGSLESIGTFDHDEESYDLNDYILSFAENSYEMHDSLVNKYL